MTTVLALARRNFLRNTVVATASCAWPAINFAQTAATPAPLERQFSPQVGHWRTFEVTTRVDIAKPQGVTRVWLPMPSVNTDWQKSLDSSFSSNGKTELTSDAHYGARMLYVEFSAAEARPFVELTSRIQTQNRAVDWTKKQATAEDAADLAYWTRPTSLLPTDGIVRKTAQEAIKGAHTDAEKVQKLYDWIVANTFREPKVRGCGEGDIKSMLETGNLGGKCADLNALFVGLCRSVGLPARDVYGLRVAPSAFGYRELGGNPAKLQGAQHCRAEFYASGFGWVPVDPADVRKVILEETGGLAVTDPKVIAIRDYLFGNWEMNWMAYNYDHDIALPGSKLGSKGDIPFLMYPQAENNEGRFDSLDPDNFKYKITSRRIS